MSNQSDLPSPGSHFIPLSRAIEMTSLYRSEREGILATPFQNRNILPICETFNRYDIDVLLAKQGCEAFRVYLGMDETLKVRVLLVAVNGNAEDILSIPSSKGPAISGTDGDDDVAEEGNRCPPACPPESPLNS